MRSPACASSDLTARRSGLGDAAVRLSRHTATVPHPTKPCVSCGRVITWRRAWATTWDDVKYCSDRCRARKVTTLDQRLEEAIGSGFGQACWRTARMEYAVIVRSADLVQIHRCAPIYLLLFPFMRQVGGIINASRR